MNHAFRGACSKGSGVLSEAARPLMFTCTVVIHSLYLFPQVSGPMKAHEGSVEALQWGPTKATYVHVSRPF